MADKFEPLGLRWSRSERGHGFVVTKMSDELNADLASNGFAMVSKFIDEPMRQRLLDDLTPLLSDAAAGVRGLASKSALVQKFAGSERIRGIIEGILGERAQLVRSILFNKDEQTNWQVGWHQDLTIAVCGRSDVAGFSAWTEKDGVTHVQPPAEVLEKMLTLRLHLDDADENNGALIVAPASHRLGKLSAASAVDAAAAYEPHVCRAAAGDMLVMRPLLLHASRKATKAAPRRVLHLEYANVDLPKPLSWAEICGHEN